MQRIRTQKFCETALHLRQQGFSYTQIKEELGVSYITAYRAVTEAEERYGLKFKNKTYAPKKIRKPT